MRPRWALVIATLSLLAWAATASAQCAWVLWTELQFSGAPVDSKRWDIQGAASSESDCKDRGMAEAPPLLLRADQVIE